MEYLKTEKFITKLIIIVLLAVCLFLVKKKNEIEIEYRKVKISEVLHEHVQKLDSVNQSLREIIAKTKDSRNETDSIKQIMTENEAKNIQAMAHVVRYTAHQRDSVWAEIEAANSDSIPR